MLFSLLAFDRTGHARRIQLASFNNNISHTTDDAILILQGLIFGDTISLVTTAVVLPDNRTVLSDSLVEEGPLHTIFPQYLNFFSSPVRSEIAIAKAWKT